MSELRSARIVAVRALPDEVERDVRRSLPLSAETRELTVLEEVEPDMARWGCVRISR